ncbi:tripartite tricarboxylate transporter TctB family protein [Bradyrhizobium centrolobii]|uniref:tripartite tricarboxylate transporter TctB family protein n=1 Tax=Bradyrhizobium centrolobii TaxID=1505087 RepID=UPI0007C4A87D|nr:tripartite tricarboxylate transporter TctB family protein [Bradyrhizobium centrolobii]
MTDHITGHHRSTSLIRRLGKDRIGALLLILIGAGIALTGMTYRMGTATRMGPGYMPFFYGVLMVLVGVAIAVTARPVDEQRGDVVPVNWRAWLCILGGLVAFAVIAVYGGLVPATFVAVFVAAMGSKANSIRDAALLAAGLAVAAVLVFSYGLKLQLALFAWG